MQYDHDLTKYKLSIEAKVSDLVHHFKTRGATLAVICDSHGRVQGVISNGDLLRFLDQNGAEALKQSVRGLMNPHFRWHLQGGDRAKLDLTLQRVDFVPILNKDKMLVAVASIKKAHQPLNINGYSLSPESPTFIIAEIGNNHNGSMDRAKELILKAKEAGADCAKFQMRDLDQLYLDKSKQGRNLKNLNTEYSLDLLKRFNLRPDQLMQLFDFTKECGLIPFCSPWDSHSLDRLAEYGMTAVKFASADLTNHQLLMRAAHQGLDMILSTGMSKESEIKDTINLLIGEKARFALLHCNSTYPTPFKDVHLNYFDRLKQMSDCILGYSGHERGYAIPIAAVAMGAKIIEKHFTDDRNQEGVDHKVSLLPEEFKLMVEAIRQVEIAKGSSNERQVSQGEWLNRTNLAKSLYAAQDISAGSIITEDMIYVSSPGRGLQPNSISRLVGVRAARDFNMGDAFYETDVKGIELKPQEYSFRNPYGVPVRFHDYKEMVQLFPKMNLVEFHLSYKDLHVDLKAEMPTNDQIDLVVHCPELFENDHLLNLCSFDEAYRKKSLDHLRRTIEFSQKMSESFTKTEKPRLIVNVGGFSDGKSLSTADKERAHETFLRSIEELDTSAIDLLPQTMPPFPWHFGGQSFHNLFIAPDEIVKTCQQTGLKICLDVSHSWMACNYLNENFSTFLKKLLPLTSHMHISDSKGTDDEGIAIGSGEVDFALVMFELAKFPEISFIPEVWQGHENNGYGFWHGLHMLNQHKI